MAADQHAVMTIVACIKTSAAILNVPTGACCVRRLREMRASILGQQVRG
jgi:hypothetical protein